MPRYSAEERHPLRETYLDAAVALVAAGGWPALNVRAVAALVQKAPSSVHQEYDEQALQLALVERAFVELAGTVGSFLEKRHPPGRFARVVAGALAADPNGGKLMAQVIAHAGRLGDAGEPTIMAAEFEKRLKVAIRDIDNLIVSYRAARVPGGDGLDAQRIVGWYIAASVLQQTAADVVGEILVI